jgi:hypothetical protein
MRARAAGIDPDTATWERDAPAASGVTEGCEWPPAMK